MTSLCAGHYETQIMLGFELDIWDYATFITFALAGLAGLVIAIFIAGLPGQIAVARKHPDAEAVKVMGYAGFLPLVPWIQAFIWAFKPTDIVDIRRFPKAEAEAIDEDIARLKDTDAKPKADAQVPPGADSPKVAEPEVNAP
jgi:hypothetical protein